MIRPFHGTLKVPSDFSWAKLADRLAASDNTILLESQEQEISSYNRYSAVFYEPLEIVKTEIGSRGEIISSVNTRDGTVRNIMDPLAYMQESIIHFQTGSGIFPGYAGMISYDYQEFLSSHKSAPLKMHGRSNVPLLFFCLHARAIIYDRQDELIHLCSLSEDERSLEDMKLLVRSSSGSGGEMQPARGDEGEKQLTRRQDKDYEKIAGEYLQITKQEYLQDLQAVHNSIARGDVYQINYTARAAVPFTGSAWELFKRLRCSNPSPFACYINGKDWQVVSSSPELLVKCWQGAVVTRPVKGTVKKTSSPEENELNRKILASSPKERAGLLMITDLERNDLGKICKTGTVKVLDLFMVEDYPTLYHLVSEIRGELRPEISHKDVIQAIFPGGSVTGAPKLAAMELISSLERYPREIYTGSVGYLGGNGFMELNIAIRTVLISRNQAICCAGGGIVWDSDNHQEYQEALLKLKAMIKEIVEYE